MLDRQCQQAFDSVAECCVLRCIGQINQKCFMQHFTGNPTTTVIMRRPPIGIAPRSVTSINQTLAGLVPALPFHHSIGPPAHIPATDARPNVADLLLACTPDFFDVVKVFFDRPAVRNNLQDCFNTHRCVRADVCRGGLGRAPRTEMCPSGVVETMVAPAELCQLLVAGVAIPKLRKHLLRCPASERFFNGYLADQTRRLNRGLPAAE